MILARTVIMKEGSQIHNSSLLKTDQPHLLKKALTLIGETLMGVQGKKNRLFLKGDSKAIPNPPSVRASRMPWLTVRKKKKIK